MTLEEVGVGGGGVYRYELSEPFHEQGTVVVCTVLMRVVVFAVYFSTNPPPHPPSPSNKKSYSPSISIFIVIQVLDNYSRVRKPSSERRISRINRAPGRVTHSLKPRTRTLGMSSNFSVVNHS